MDRKKCVSGKVLSGLAFAEENPNNEKGMLLSRAGQDA
jgi:hypothetical protein